MALPGEIGWIGKPCPECKRPLETIPYCSGAGWFVATTCATCAPGQVFSRESSYYPSESSLLRAMTSETVRWRDTTFHGDGR